MRFAMWTRFTKKLSKDHFMGIGAVAGVLYYGYTNVMNTYRDMPPEPGFGSERRPEGYRVASDHDPNSGTRPVQRSVATLPLRGSDPLERDETILNNFEFDVSKTLRSGDLVFIQYDLSRLNMYRRIKLRFVRLLTHDHSYDDLGVVYRCNNRIYIVLIPNVPTRLKAPLANYNPFYSSVVAVEYDTFIREKHPYLVSVRRLICNEDERARVQGEIASLLHANRFRWRCDTLTILESWRQGQRAATLAGSDRMKAEYIYNEIHSSKERLKMHANVDLWGKISQDFRKNSKDPHVEEYLNGLYALEAELYSWLRLEEWANSVVFGSGGHVWSLVGLGRLSSASTLANLVYGGARLLPNGSVCSRIGFYDFLTNRSLQHTNPMGPRLTSLAHIYRGGLLSSRYENLKRPQVNDMLHSKS